MTLQSKLDAIVWPKPLGEGEFAFVPMEDEPARSRAALALLDLCREWIAEDPEEDHGPDRDALLAKLDEVCSK